jgi:hypothetical protein
MLWHIPNLALAFGLCLDGGKPDIAQQFGAKPAKRAAVAAQRKHLPKCFPKPTALGLRRGASVLC